MRTQQEDTITPIDLPSSSGWSHTCEHMGNTDWTWYVIKKSRQNHNKSNQKENFPNQ